MALYMKHLYKTLLDIPHYSKLTKYFQVFDLNQHFLQRKHFHLNGWVRWAQESYLADLEHTILNIPFG